MARATIGEEKEAKARLEAKARAKAEEEQRRRDEEQAKREAEGRHRRGKEPAPVDSNPEEKAQTNFTDPESKIMKQSNKERAGINFPVSPKYDTKPSGHGVWRRAAWMPMHRKSNG